MLLRPFSNNVIHQNCAMITKLKAALGRCTKPGCWKPAMLFGDFCAGEWCVQDAVREAERKTKQLLRDCDNPYKVHHIADPKALHYGLSAREMRDALLIYYTDLGCVFVLKNDISGTTGHVSRAKLAELVAIAAARFE